jgi:hypothetical protein
MKWPICPASTKMPCSGSQKYPWTQHINFLLEISAGATGPAWWADHSTAVRGGFHGEGREKQPPDRPIVDGRVSASECLESHDEQDLPWWQRRSLDGHRPPERPRGPPLDDRAFHKAVLQEILQERVSSRRNRINSRSVKRKMSNSNLRPRRRGRTRRISFNARVRLVK